MFSTIQIAFSPNLVPNVSAAVISSCVLDQHGWQVQSGHGPLPNARCRSSRQTMCIPPKHQAHGAGTPQAHR